MHLPTLLVGAALAFTTSSTIVFFYLIRKYWKFSGLFFKKVAESDDAREWVRSTLQLVLTYLVPRIDDRARRRITGITLVVHDDARVTVEPSSDSFASSARTDADAS